MPVDAASGLERRNKRIRRASGGFFCIAAKPFPWFSHDLAKKVSSFKPCVSFHASERAKIK
jgi:hypothetical protein